MRNLDAPQNATNAVRRRYSASDGYRVKEPKFRAVVRLFKLSPKGVARVSGFSRPYISRVLSRKDDFTGSPEFFRTMELRLGTVIEGRTAQFFTVPN
jgi:hypothetical protein